MRLLHQGLAATVAAIALFASGSGAAGAQDDPVAPVPATLSVPGETARWPQVAAAADGTATVVWERYVNDTATDTTIQAKTRSADGVWGSTANLSESITEGADPQVAASADGSATAVWIGTAGRLVAAFQPAGGSWSAPSPISTAGQVVDKPQIGLAGDATATVVWVNRSSKAVQAATRPAGGAWSAPVDLSTGNQELSIPQIAVGADGSAVAVWAALGGGRVQAASRSAAGAWSAATDVSDAAESAVVPQVAIAPDGSAAIVWRGGDASGAAVKTSTRLAVGAWSTPVQLSPRGLIQWAPQVGLAADGTATAVWAPAEDTAGTVVGSATHPAAGTWSEPIDASFGAGLAPQVAVAANGSATVVWEGGGANGAATRSGGGAWSRALEFGGGKFVQGLQVSVAGSGPATAVWVRSNGSDIALQATTIPPLSSVEPQVVLRKTPPKLLASPKISGRAKVGRTLTCRGARFSDATRTTTRWTRGGKTIKGATKSTYKLKQGDRGRTIGCVVRATGAGGTKSASSRRVRVARR